MDRTEYLGERALQELKAAMEAFDQRVRQIHLQLADAYSACLSELKLGTTKSPGADTQSDVTTA